MLVFMVTKSIYISFPSTQLVLYYTIRVFFRTGFVVGALTRLFTDITIFIETHATRNTFRYRANFCIVADDCTMVIRY